MVFCWVMHVPSASSKIFWLCSNFFCPLSIFFEHIQNFLFMVKSDILPYKFAYLSMVKISWPHSYNIVHGQKILYITKFFWISKWMRQKYNFDIFLPLITKYQFLNKILSPKSAVKRDIVIVMKSKAKKRRKCLWKIWEVRVWSML